MEMIIIEHTEVADLASQFERVMRWVCGVADGWVNEWGVMYPKETHETINYLMDLAEPLNHFWLAIQNSDYDDEGCYIHEHILEVYQCTIQQLVSYIVKIQDDIPQNRVDPRNRRSEWIQ